MRRVVWSDESRGELRKAIKFIADNDPVAARIVRSRIDQATRLLADMPVGHQGRVKGTYEKLILRMSYILAYALSGETITILHLIHAHRD